MSQAKILVVDDEPDIRLLIREILEDEGYLVETAENGDSARNQFSSIQPDLVLLDIWMPDIDGISLLKEWSETGRLVCPVVMISGHGTLETAVEATRLGAHDFIQKPLSLAKLLATVKNALTSGTKQAPSAPPPREPAHEPQGTSPEMQLLRQKAEQAARHDSPVVITGETGTGREALAAYLHRLAGRSGEFVILDECRLGGEEARNYLLGSGDSPGPFAQAAGGTLYIPDLAALDPDVQAIISAVIDSGMITPVGSDAPMGISCRLIAGAGPGLEDAVRQGEVSEQLYLQLNVLALHVPALRERPQDVPDLVGFYNDHFSNNEGLTYRHFAIAALNRLRNHSWPGNERELRNVVQRLLILGGEGEVSVQEVDETLREPVPEVSSGLNRIHAFELPLREAREQFEREYLIYQLQKAGGSVGKLSEAVGMERTHLYRKLRSLKIDPKAVKSGDSN